MSYSLSRAFLLTLFIIIAAPAKAEDAIDSRPNIVVIVSDDQRYGTMREHMPLTFEKIFEPGIEFTRGYVTTPACCPSRSSILTGMYASKHKVKINSDRLTKRTFMKRLSSRGYYTGLVGKYLNSWNGKKRREYDYWVTFKKGSSHFFNPRLNVNGRWENHTGYITDIFRDYSLDFIDKARQSNKPFALLLTFNAPHAPAQVATRHVGLFDTLNDPRPIGYMDPDVRDKPRYVQRLKAINQVGRANYDRFHKNQLLTLYALDEAIGAFVDKLEDSGELENTLIIFLSDNGLMWGEHGLVGKDCPYEPAVHVPFAVRFDQMLEQGRVDDALVANIDIAPTAFELAEITKPRRVDGRSLLHRIADPESPHRDTLLIEGWRNIRARRAFKAIHTGEEVFVLNHNDKNEYYDLRIDPHQLANKAYHPAYSTRVRELYGKLVRSGGRRVRKFIRSYR